MFLCHVDEIQQRLHEKGIGEKVNIIYASTTHASHGAIRGADIHMGDDAVVKAKMRIFAPLALHGQEWDTHSFKKADMLIAPTKIICSRDCMKLGTKWD